MPRLEATSLCPNWFVSSEKELRKWECLGCWHAGRRWFIYHPMCRRPLHLLPCGLGANLPERNDIFGSPYLRRQGSKCRSKHPIINHVLLSCELNQISCPRRDGVNFPRRNLSKSGNIPRKCGEVHCRSKDDTTHIKHT